MYNIPIVDTLFAIEEFNTANVYHKYLLGFV